RAHQRPGGLREHARRAHARRARRAAHRRDPAPPGPDVRDRRRGAGAGARRLARPALRLGQPRAAARCARLRAAVDDRDGVRDRGAAAARPASPVLALLWMSGGVSGVGAAVQASYPRLVAIILRGGAGLVACLPCVWFSAPDLALTQGAVELVTTILFLLGLR